MLQLKRGHKGDFKISLESFVRHSRAKSFLKNAETSLWRRQCEQIWQNFATLAKGK